MVPGRIAEANGAELARAVKRVGSVSAGVEPLWCSLMFLSSRSYTALTCFFVATSVSSVWSMARIWLVIVVSAVDIRLNWLSVILPPVCDERAGECKQCRNARPAGGPSGLFWL